MNNLFHEFINLFKKLGDEIKLDDYLKQIKSEDYLKYLQNFDEFHEIQYSYKEKYYKKYKRYLENLITYLRDFF